jgi:hypothetical protein
MLGLQIIKRETTHSLLATIEDRSEKRDRKLGGQQWQTGHELRTGWRLSAGDSSIGRESWIHWHPGQQRQHPICIVCKLKRSARAGKKRRQGQGREETVHTSAASGDAACMAWGLRRGDSQGSEPHAEKVWGARKRGGSSETVLPGA